MAGTASASSVTPEQALRRLPPSRRCLATLPPELNAAREAGRFPGPYRNMGYRIRHAAACFTLY